MEKAKDYEHMPLDRLVNLYHSVVKTAAQKSKEGKTEKAASILWTAEDLQLEVKARLEGRPELRRK